MSVSFFTAEGPHQKKKNHNITCSPHSDQTILYKAIKRFDICHQNMYSTDNKRAQYFLADTETYIRIKPPPIHFLIIHN